MAEMEGAADDGDTVDVRLIDLVDRLVEIRNLEHQVVRADEGGVRNGGEILFDVGGETAGRLEIEGVPREHDHADGHRMFHMVDRSFQVWRVPASGSAP